MRFDNQSEFNIVEVGEDEEVKEVERVVKENLDLLNNTCLEV